MPRDEKSYSRIPRTSEHSFGGLDIGRGRKRWGGALMEEGVRKVLTGGG